MRYLDIDITAYSSLMFIIISERNVVPLVICYVFFYSEFVDQVSHDYLQHYSGILCYSSSKPAIARDCAGSFLVILSWSLVAPARSFLFSLLLRLPCKAKSATSQISLKHKSRRVQHSIRIPIPQVMSLQSRGVACWAWVDFNGAAILANLLRVQSYGNFLIETLPSTESQWKCEMWYRWTEQTSLDMLDNLDSSDNLEMR